ncbi:MAG: hypothetical protein V4476_03595 [Pseudomonadota bacterium]
MNRTGDRAWARSAVVRVMAAAVFLGAAGVPSAMADDAPLLSRVAYEGALPALEEEPAASVVLLLLLTLVVLGGTGAQQRPEAFY